MHIKWITVNGNGYASICYLPHIDIQVFLQNACYVHTQKKIYQFVCIPLQYCKAESLRTWIFINVKSKKLFTKKETFKYENEFKLYSKVHCQMDIVLFTGRVQMMLCKTEGLPPCDLRHYRLRQAYSKLRQFYLCFRLKSASFRFCLTLI